jgi:hypothetical protein
MHVRGGDLCYDVRRSKFMFELASSSIVEVSGSWGSSSTSLLLDNCR